MVLTFETLNNTRADETEREALPIEDFKLPVDQSIPETLSSGEQALRLAKWKWIDTDWKPVIIPNETDDEGWIYTDNTWKNPGPNEAFGKYTVICIMINLIIAS
jgi:Integral peroxisomal membrane peroxin